MSKKKTPVRNTPGGIFGAAQCLKVNIAKVNHAENRNFWESCTIGGMCNWRVVELELVMAKVNIPKTNGAEKWEFF